MPAVGYATKTNSAIIGTSSTPKILYSVNFTSDSTAGVLAIYDGHDTNGTLVWQQTGVINQGVSVYFASSHGISLSNGIYLSLDGHVTRATVAYQEVI